MPDADKPKSPAPPKPAHDPQKTTAGAAFLVKYVKDKLKHIECRMGSEMLKPSRNSDDD